MNSSEIEAYSDDELEKFKWIVADSMKKGTPKEGGIVHSIARWLATNDKCRKANLKERTLNGGDK